ncbi:MAG: hypothetical protein PHY34_00965 [Patescibacteria group bacterium]|nr:hypothetical protein [Patescibacteria group bacterium]MDD5715800.1 hypothetical protein [Patescibacteria group bacterium]
MDELAVHNAFAATGPADDASIAGKSLLFYWRATRIIIVLLILLEIGAVVYDLFLPYGPWIADAIAFVLMTGWLLKRYQVRLSTAIAAAIYVSCIAGLLLVIFDLAWYRELVYLLNIIRRPFITGCIGIAITFGTYLIYQTLTTKRNRSDAKGGVMYGRTKE